MDPNPDFPRKEAPVNKHDANSVIFKFHQIPGKATVQLDTALSSAHLDTTGCFSPSHLKHMPPEKLEALFNLLTNLQPNTKNEKTIEAIVEILNSK